MIYIGPSLSRFHYDEECDGKRIIRRISSHDISVSEITLLIAGNDIKLCFDPDHLATVRAVKSRLGIDENDLEILFLIYSPRTEHRRGAFFFF